MILKLITASIAFALAANCFADTLTAPVMGKKLTNKGLTLKYKLNSRFPQKLTCLFDNLYQGTVEYEDNKVKKVILWFGTGDTTQQFYFTSKGETWHHPEEEGNLSQIHVDPEGSISINNANYYNATVTCFYVSET